MFQTFLEKLNSAGVWQAVGAGVVPCLVVLIVVISNGMRRRRSKQMPSPDLMLEAAMEKVRKEFSVRIPIVRAYFIRGGSTLEDSRLDIRYVVETAAAEDSVDSSTYKELWDRTRDEVLASGYYRERRDALSALVVSEERFRKFGNDYYIRGGRWPEEQTESGEHHT
jgi:hypothetical protein